MKRSHGLAGSMERSSVLKRAALVSRKALPRGLPHWREGGADGGASLRASGVFTHMCTCMYVCVCVHLHMHVFVSVNVYVFMCESVVECV